MSEKRRSPFSQFNLELENSIEVLGRAVHELDEVGESGSIPPSLMDEIASATHTIRILLTSGSIPTLELNALTYQFEVMVEELKSGKIDLAPSVIDALQEAVPVFRQILAAEKEGSNGTTIDVGGLLDQVASALSTARAAANETAWERALLARLDDDEMQRLHTNITRGDKPYLIEVSIAPRDVGRRLFELRMAIKMHGALITYQHTGTDEATEAMLVDIVMTSMAAEEPLHAVMATLGMTMRHLPELTKRLATRPPRTPKDDGPNDTEARGPAERKIRIHDKMPYRFYLRSQVAAMDACLNKLRQAAKPHGGIVAWNLLATRDPEVIDIEVFMKSRASGSVLKAAFAHLGATAEQQPELPGPEEESVEPSEEEHSEFPRNAWLCHYKTPAWNMPIDEADRVELLCLPECTVISDANWPEAFFDFVSERHMLAGAEAQQVIQHFGDLAPAEPALCHMPPWGLAFYAGDSLLFTVTLCYQCSNAYVYSGHGKKLRAFATYSPAGQALAAILDQHMPCLKLEG